ncbi:MAG TPA: hypothetical protein PLX89_02925 [Verrucomicrobiota bacterium]|nr:hypothetical protein [Verrucomicrobiota bacterium]
MSLPSIEIPFETVNRTGAPSRWKTAAAIVALSAAVLLLGFAVLGFAVTAGRLTATANDGLISSFDSSLGDLAADPR